MVVKKSEYQNQFKSSVINKNQSAYLENLTFRNERRDREFIHTPINWQNQTSDEVVSSDEETNENTNCNANSKAEHDGPQYLSLAEILDESKAKNKAFRQQVQKKDNTYSKDILSLCNINGITLEDKSNQTKDISDLCEDDESKKLDEVANEKKLLRKNEDTSEKVDIQHEKSLKARSNVRRKTSGKKKSYSKAPDSMEVFSSQKVSDAKFVSDPEPATSQVPSLAIAKKPRRPDRQRRIPSAKYRPMSQERPPFLAYGAGDREETFTTHRTHNVRSTVDVYGAALRAKIRREEEKKRQLERQKRLAQSTSDLMEKLAEATPRDMCDWRSEYQKQFHGYEPKTYERSFSSRAVISHSAPIRAIHRGGGLIVHVD